MSCNYLAACSPFEVCFIAKELQMQQKTNRISAQKRSTTRAVTQAQVIRYDDMMDTPTIRSITFIIKLSKAIYLVLGFYATIQILNSQHA